MILPSEIEHGGLHRGLVKGWDHQLAEPEIISGITDVDLTTDSTLQDDRLLHAGDGLSEAIVGVSHEHTELMDLSFHWEAE